MHPHPLHNLVYDRLHAAPSGVFLHWGAYESGKSTAVRVAAQRLQDTRVVYRLHGFDVTSDETVEHWLRERLALRLSDAFAAAFQRTPGTLIFDHADTLFRVPDFLHTLRALAGESKRSQRFNVLVVLASYERARDLLRDLHGAELLGEPACGRWTRAQLRPIWEGRASEAVLDLAETAGTPAFLLLALRGSEWASPARAEALEYEWRNAALALGGAREFAPGRFPDRDAVFHFHPDLPLSTAETP